MGGVRWDELFVDLEALGAAVHRSELDAEVADRVRRERALIPLRARLAGLAATQSLDPGGSPVGFRLLGGLALEGRVTDVGADWCVVVDGVGRSWLIPLTALQRIDGMAWAATSGQEMGRRFRFGFAIRALARDRAVVQVHDITGWHASGTIDAVGADHFDISEHPIDLPRRAANVRSRHVVPFSAVAAIADHTASLGSGAGPSWG